MITQNEIDLVRELFIHRNDAHYRKYPTWQLSKNALTDRMLELHLKGTSGFRIGTLSTQPPPDNTCRFVAADFDDNTLAHKQAWQLYDHLEKIGLHPLVELSHSGKGYHVWLFFEEPVLASKARTLMWNALVRAGIPISGNTGKGKNTGRALDKLFPAQDTITANGYGNQIGLPLYGSKCQFVDRHDNPFPDQWAVLEEALKNRTPANHTLLEEDREEGEGVPAIQKGSAPSPTTSDTNSWLRQMELPGNAQNVTRLRGCEMIKAGIEDANQFKEPAWHAGITNLAVFRKDGLPLAQEFSKGYLTEDYQYKPEETEQKFYRSVDAIQQAQSPVSCKTLAALG